MDQFPSPEETIQPSGSPLKGQAIIETFGRILTVLALLFTFLVGVKILTSGIKLMGGGFAQTLF
ncbi:MAG: hypothetical protein VXW15_00220, partial [Bdellovibrionota bacterium]|nr:hypothetical protein [Bdellovibrionota bacterium]